MPIRRVWTCAALVVAAATTACIGRADDRPVAGRVALRIGVVLPDTPGFGLSSLVDGVTRERLTTRGRDGRREPALLASWTSSADARRWRLHLRPDLRLHDGTPLTAATLARAIDAAQFSLAATTVLSETELELQSATPAPLLIEDLRNRLAFDAGAFVLETRSDTMVQLRSFDGFHLGRPTIDELTFRLYPSLRAAWTSLLRGELDGLYEAPPTAVDFIEASSELRAYTFRRPYAYMLALNLHRPVLSRVEARRAISQAIRRDRLIGSALRGRGEPAHFQLVPSHWLVAQDVEPLPFSLSDARRLWASATAASSSTGAPSNSGTSSAAAPPLVVRCLVPRLERFMRVGQEVQRQLLDLGIDLDLQPIDAPDLGAELVTGRFDAVILEANGATAGFLETFWHSSDPPRLLDSGYRAADAALDRWRASPDEQDARVAMREVQQVLRDDPPAVFLAWSQAARVLHGRYAVPATAPGEDVFDSRVLPFISLRPAADPR